MKLGIKLFLLIGIFFSYIQSQDIMGIVLKMRGKATIIRDGNIIPIKLKDIILKDDTIQTSDKGWLFIEQPSKNIIKLSSQTNIKFNNSKLVTQDSGKIFFKVQKSRFVKGLSKTLPSFTIKTKTATMGIRGTNFVIDVDDSSEKIILRDGDLRVNANKGSFNYFKSELLAEMQKFKDEFAEYKKQNEKEFKAYKESFAGYKPQPPVSTLQVKPRRVINIDSIKGNLFEDNFNKETDVIFDIFDDFGGFKNTKVKSKIIDNDTTLDDDLFDSSDIDKEFESF